MSSPRRCAQHGVHEGFSTATRAIPASSLASIGAKKTRARLGCGSRADALRRASDARFRAGKKR